MPDLSAIDTVRAIADPVHDVGTAIYLSPDVAARAETGGYANPFAFYFAGRGGMLGDVDAEVVAAAFGWFNPDVVSALYAEGRDVHGARGAGERMMEATALWGDDHLAGVDADVLARFVELAERLVDGAEASGLPLFAAWRSRPRASSVPGRAAQLCQILREWRGAVHLVATTAVGLSPLEAILTNEGPGQAAFFGWPEPFPDCGAISHRHAEAEEITDRLCAVQVERLLSRGERAELVAGVAEIAVVALAG